MLGRRGPAQAAFTSAELRELGRLDGVDLRVDAADVELDPVSQRSGSPRRARSPRARTSSCCASSPPGRRAPARRADRAALPVLAGRDPRRRTRRGRRRPPQRDRARATTARCAPAPVDEPSRRSSAASSCAPSATAPCRCPTCPFDERHFVLPNERGPRARARRRAAPGRLRGRLDQARADRDPRHQQARRRGDGRLPGRGPARRARCRAAAADRERSTRCSPSARRPRHGRRLARDRPPRARARPRRASARGSSSRRATSCSRPRQDLRARRRRPRGRG